MSRNTLNTELKTLLRQHWAKLEVELEQHTLAAARDRIDNMLRLIDIVGVYYVAKTQEPR